MHSDLSLTVLPLQRWLLCALVQGGVINPILCEAAGRKNNACICEEGGTREFQPRFSEEMQYSGFTVCLRWGLFL